ncbi:hypothetical protein HHL21_12215 [Massilia sp. RP-1-19]|uniref:Uncharacterized protein n=1 Tax=Massilia polaris TaxID=2728846 RepID=A0A848HK94_9BURK|nr:hypothetical protein [Massilia polaris]NML61825.1 hypothetical protein [Massilia polaris]
MIVASTFTEGPAQADGRIPIHELHVADDGREFKRTWLWDGTLNVGMVLEAAAEVFTQTLADRKAALLAVVGMEVPYTNYEFIDRFTAQEYADAREAAEADIHVAFFMKKLDSSKAVYMTLARPGIARLLQLGKLTTERAAVIGAD